MAAWGQVLEWSWTSAGPARILFSGSAETRTEPSYESPSRKNEVTGAGVPSEKMTRGWMTVASPTWTSGLCLAAAGYTIAGKAQRNRGPGNVLRCTGRSMCDGV